MEAMFGFHHNKKISIVFLVVYLFLSLGDQGLILFIFLSMLLLPSLEEKK